MTQETASRLVEANLTALYGYAISRLYDKSKAEDLASEIVVEILRSAENLKDDSAFWGFAWRIAENTFHRFIRRERMMLHALPLEDANNIAAVLPPQDEPDDRDDQIFRLRRELSLLSHRYRGICVSYYVNNKSCSDIAQELHISVETVKQTLFRARNRLKEGMEMERKLGEKSYNPGTFKLGFWGNWNHYDRVCDRKLPGAILLAAYNNPMTAEELSLELGVAMPYLEEEIEALDAAGLLLQTGKKLETNIVIITGDYEKSFEQQTRPLYATAAQHVYAVACELLPQIRALDFQGNDYDDNRLLFGLINIALMNGNSRAGELAPISPPQKLPLGGEGWLYGIDNNFENIKFCGIAGHANNAANTARFSAVNYCVLSSAQHFEHRNFLAKIEGMCDAILEKAPDPANETLPYLIENGFIRSNAGKLSANFPVFSQDVFDTLTALLSPISEMVAKSMVEISNKAEPILAATAPSRLRGQCKDLTKIIHRLDIAAYIMEALIEAGRLTVPTEKTPLCIYGVRT